MRCDVGSGLEERRASTERNVTRRVVPPPVRRPRHLRRRPGGAGTERWQRTSRVSGVEGRIALNIGIKV